MVLLASAVLLSSDRAKKGEDATEDILKRDLSSSIELCAMVDFFKSDVFLFKCCMITAKINNVTMTEKNMPNNAL
jgi:hypothetical protein